MSYRELIEQHVWRYGIPLAFYSDRHGIFTPVGDHRTLSRNYQLTDYERVCRHLGIETIYAHSPQAKGRIERLNKFFKVDGLINLPMKGLLILSKPILILIDLLSNTTMSFRFRHEKSPMLIFHSVNLVNICIESVPVGVRRTLGRIYRFHRTKNALRF